MEKELMESSKVLLEYGALGAIAAVFILSAIIEKWYHAKYTTKIMEELAAAIKLQSKTMEGLSQSIKGINQSCENTANALKVIDYTLKTVTTNQEIHDRKVTSTNHEMMQLLLKKQQE